MDPSKRRSRVAESFWNMTPKNIPIYKTKLELRNGFKRENQTIDLS